MPIPPGYALRAPTRDDLDDVAAVLVADDFDRVGQPVLGADFVREVWSRPGFDLAEDAWVVTDGAGTIVAYGQVRREDVSVVGSWGVVHPEHRGRGVGAEVLNLVDARASELLRGVPSARFRHSVAAGDAAAEAMLRSRGLRPVRHFWHMRIDLTEPVDPGAPPRGIEIGGVDPTEDLAAVHAVLEDAFADDWGFHPQPFERWAADEARNPGYDPSLWLVARDAGRVVGVLTASEGEDGGAVDYLAVLASHRGRGIGAALLRRSFASLAGRDRRSVMLSVDAENPTGATALYERVGMRVVNRWDLWERLPGGG